MSSAYYYSLATKHENFNKKLENLHKEIDEVRSSLASIQNNMNKILIDRTPVDFGAIDSTNKLLVSSMNYIADMIGNNNIKITELWELYRVAKIDEETERLKQANKTQEV